MTRRLQALAFSALFVGFLGTAAAQDQAGASDAEGASGSGGAMGAPAGGFKWSGAGELKTEKGKIDKFEEGKVKAGGVLGMGGTNFNVTNDTLIVSENGKKLSRKDLQPGKEIAAIYKESEQTDQNTALVVVVSQKAAGGGAAGQDSGSSNGSD